jgi:CTP synthase
LNLKASKSNLKEWKKVVGQATNVYDKKIRIGIVAKYLNNQDTYMSVFEALKAAAWDMSVKPELIWIDAEKLITEAKVSKAIKSVDGIVVPGGFGSRALEGKIAAAQYALKHKVPYLGLCLGLQMAVIAAARNAGIKDASTRELNPKSANLVIDTMTDQLGKENTGGTMRLGDYDCKLTKGTLARKLYKQDMIVERHRHRYECNNDYRDQYESWGIMASGTSPDKHLVEVIEALNHPFFIFKSRPNRPHPLFAGFVKSLL